MSSTRRSSSAARLEGLECVEGDGESDAASESIGASLPGSAPWNFSVSTIACEAGVGTVV